MDPVSLIAIISASSALVVSILTHIKFSRCCGFVLRTTEGNESSPTTPTTTTPLIQSQPIDIPKPPPIFNKNNYL
jgi:hypothetical protein